MQQHDKMKAQPKLAQRMLKNAKMGGHLISTCIGSKHSNDIITQKDR